MTNTTNNLLPSSKTLTSHPQMLTTLSQQDKDLLVSLAYRYNYITRDEDGALYAFVNKPTKMKDCWIALNDNDYKYLGTSAICQPQSQQNTQLHQQLQSLHNQHLLFIQFSDKQPFQIIPQIKEIQL